MPITELQRIERKKHVGSSDMSAILGCNPYQTAYDVWLVKTGKVELEPTTESMEDGTYLEARLLDHAEKEWQLTPLERNVHKILDGFPIATNVDAVVIDTNEPVEAKTTGMNTRPSAEWGEAGTDQVPDNVIIQCQVHLACLNAAICHVPAWIFGRGKFLYYVPRNEDLIDLIKTESVKFWACVERDVPPENSLPTLSVLKLIRPQPKKTIIIPAEHNNLIISFDYLKQETKLANEKKNLVEAEVRALLGDAEIGECEVGILTNTIQNRKEYTVKATSFPVLKFKSRKEIKNGNTISTTESD